MSPIVYELKRAQLMADLKVLQDEIVPEHSRMDREMNHLKMKQIKTVMDALNVLKLEYEQGKFHS